MALAIHGERENVHLPLSATAIRKELRRGEHLRRWQTRRLSLLCGYWGRVWTSRLQSDWIKLGETWGAEFECIRKAREGRLFKHTWPMAF